MTIRVTRQGCLIALVVTSCLAGRVRVGFAAGQSAGEGHPRANLSNPHRVRIYQRIEQGLNRPRPHRNRLQRACNWVGDTYHKHFYRHMTAMTGWVTDKTDRCFTDVLLAWHRFPLLTVAVLAAALTNSYVNVSLNLDQGHAQASEVLADVAWKGLALGGALVFVSGFANHLRTPLRHKLGLALGDVDLDAEIAYTQKQLETVADVEKPTIDEAAPRINAAIDTFIESVEGYPVHRARKVKRSLFSEDLRKRVGYGLYSPIFQEVVNLDPTQVVNTAHEMVHLVGYLPEAEAEFIPYAALIGSGDRQLQRVAWEHRLNLLQLHKDINNQESILRTLRTAAAERIGYAARFLTPWRVPPPPELLYTRGEGSEKRKLSTLGIFGMTLWGHGSHLRSAFSPMMLFDGERSKFEGYVRRPVRMISALDPPVDVETLP